MKNNSLFDVISPIMVGPSSSHTAGAVRLGLLARNIYAQPVKKITFRLYNSFAQTGKGHGTDKGLMAGLLGFQVDDVRIKKVFELPEAKEIEYDFEYLEDFNRHPNAVDFIFGGKDKMEIFAESVGAGNVRVRRINKFGVDITGEYDTLVLIYKDKPGMLSKVGGIIQGEKINIASLICDRSAKGEDASMCIALDSGLNYSVVQKIKNIEDVYFVRHVSKIL
ncbi:MAG TPA: L-serine ammonia-lyase, iron-sulfur-dependent subunit beta [Candidatus Gastranaerophilaceae bacterium]|nr:L-serine ammonia-lyase, iron-sulfur-dependent subunit beta [Candidatus Gastranaerophilaceae bacterium]